MFVRSLRPVSFFGIPRTPLSSGSYDSCILNPRFTAITLCLNSRKLFTGVNVAPSLLYPVLSSPFVPYNRLLLYAPPFVIIVVIGDADVCCVRLRFDVCREWVNCIEVLYRGFDSFPQFYRRGARTETQTQELFV